MEIIYSFNLNKILKCAVVNKFPCMLINLKHLPVKDRDILTQKGIKEIKLDGLTDEERQACEREYIENIADIGFKHQSIEWWANPVSEKNEHISELFKKLCRLYGIVKVIERYVETDIRIYLVCDADIFEQIRAYCAQNSLKVSTLERFIWFRELREKLSALPQIFLSLGKILIRKIYLSYTMGFTMKKIDNAKKYYVIRTWIDNRFIKDSDIYRDSYFGKLPQYIAAEGYDVIILAGIIGDYREANRKINRLKGFQIIPEEFFLRLLDFLRVFLRLHFRKTRLKQRVLFRDIDATRLYEIEISKGYFNADYLKNILRFFIAKRFSEAVKFNKYIQTFENYAWEKMTILGIRETNPKMKIYGFQHAFISRNSFKYFPGEKEKDIIPLPDRIITMGKRTKEIIEKYGNYKTDILNIGCALRQEYLNALKPFKRRRFNKVVVPLTMVRNESILIMNFLHESGLSQTDIKVVIRCHPAAPFDSFKKYIDFKMPYNFLINNEKKVYEELSTTDMVLYTWTTVSVEALKMGLPVIYLDIFEYMYVDPLFECSFLKRAVSSPEKLLLVIRELYNMTDAEFYHEQALAQEYVRDYFYPATEENLSAFMRNNVSA